MFKLSPQLLFSFLLYFALLCVYTVFSYSLTDPNLVLTSWSPYWNFQQWMWRTFFENRQFMTYCYAGVITALFGSYFFVLKNISRLDEKFETINLRSFSVMLIALLAPLAVSYNALSHDVFNYIFNAKMVLVYHSNPHQKVALDFPQDEWLRFMHNTHTPAPYGYGWTGFSLLPYSLGMGKFVITWLLFRLTSIVSIFALFLSLLFLHKQLGQKRAPLFEYALLFFNPLLLIEIVSNSHNDLWMMAPAVLSLGVVFKEKNFAKVLLSAVLLAVSISIKFASLALLPLWFYFVIRQYVSLGKVATLVEEHWPELASFLMMLPLFTARSQQFHPWYFTWVLTWVPFMKNRWWKYSVIVLSLSSLFRYIPWLWAGDFSDQVLLQQKMTTWIPFIMFAVTYAIYLQTQSSRTSVRGKVQ